MKSIHASNLEVNDEGYVIHNDNIIKVKVRRVEDISLHGSSLYVFWTNEIEGNYNFSYLLSKKEATKILSKKIKNQLKDIDSKRKILKKKLRKTNKKGY